MYYFMVWLKTECGQWLVFKYPIYDLSVCFCVLCMCVQILNTYQTGNSLTVSLVYVVWNGSTALNGTMASGLMNQLTAELVGYFLFFPPMLIAERKFHCIKCL